MSLTLLTSVHHGRLHHLGWTIQDRERYRLAREDDAAAVLSEAIAKVKEPLPHVGIGTWRCSQPWPWIIGSFIDEVLKIIQCPGGDACDSLLVSLSEATRICPHVGT